MNFFFLFLIDENEKQQREKCIDQIIDEMRSYKRTPTLVLLKDKGKSDISFFFLFTYVCI
jgi:hypothetical protein